MTADPISSPVAIRVDLGAIFLSLDLSKSTWLVTSLSPGSEKKNAGAFAGNLGNPRTLGATLRVNI